MRRQFVSGFPRALLSFSQEKSSGVEIGSKNNSNEKEKIKIRFIYPLLSENVIGVIVCVAKLVGKGVESYYAVKKVRSSKRSHPPVRFQSFRHRAHS